MQLTEGDLSEALGSHRQSLEIAQRLAALDPRNIRWQRDFFVSHFKMASVERHRESPSQALAHFEAAPEIDAAMIRQDPDTAQWADDRRFPEDIILPSDHGAERVIEMLRILSQPDEHAQVV